MLRSQSHTSPSLEEGPRKTIETSKTRQSHAYFLLFCEEGLPPGIFLPFTGQWTLEDLLDLENLAVLMHEEC